MDRPDHLGQPIGKFSSMRPAPLLTALAGIAVVAGLLAFGADYVGHRKSDAPGKVAATEKVTPAPADLPPAAADTAATTGANPAPQAAAPDQAGSPPSTSPASPAAPQTPASAQATADAQTPPANLDPAGSNATSPDQPKVGAASAPPAAPAAPAPDLKPIELPKPFAERAGILTFNDRTLQLAGIQPTDPSRTCAGENGKEWPCGTMARTALRSFLRGRNISCDLPNDDWQGSVTTTCRYARTDLSQWLAESGWVEVEPGASSALSAAENQARADKRGIFGNDPRKDNPSTLAPAPRPENPLNPI
jgi:endonuclease YncB( thermonuclease family)